MRLLIYLYKISVDKEILNQIITNFTKLIERGRFELIKADFEDKDFFIKMKSLIDYPEL